MTALLLCFLLPDLICIEKEVTTGKEVMINGKREIHQMAQKNYKDNWAWAFFTIGNFGFGQWLFRYKQTCHKKFETVFGKVQLRSCICKLGKEEGLVKMLGIQSTI